MTLIISVLVGAVGFFGGMKYADYQRTQGRANGNRQFPGANTRQTQGRNGMGRPIVGEVISKDNTSLTVKTQDGGSRIIMLSAATTYSKSTAGTVQDVVVGGQVAVVGTENSDKSVTADSIQLNPQFRMGSDNAKPTPTK